MTARSLFDFISNLVDLPKLDKWKLEELNRLLDPNNDNRYVDMETWSGVGKSWVDMMMNPDYHSLSTSDKSSASEACDVEDVEPLVPVPPPAFCHDHEELITNISFGSIEGYGAGNDMAASARELELEGKVEELNYQLNKLKDKNRELETNLVASEEFGLSLTSELEDSHRRLSLSSTMLTKTDKQPPDTSNTIREWEQECAKLQRKIIILEDEVLIKETKLGDMEVLNIYYFSFSIIYSLTICRFKLSL